MSLDNDLRTLLNAEADRFEPPRRVPSGLLRRARVQRLGAAAVLVAAAALAGSVMTTTPDRPSLPPNDALPGTVIEGLDGHASYVVATGKDQGVSWTLSAHEDEDGLCVEISHDQGGGGGCGKFKPNRLAMSINSGDGDDPLSIKGAVGPKVDSVVVEYQSDDGRVEAVIVAEDFYDAPRQISLPVRFFIIFLPRGATPKTVTALDAAGDVVEENGHLDRHLRAPGPPTEPEEQIATGRLGGQVWELFGGQHEQGLCFEFYLGTDRSDGGGSCDSSVDDPFRLALAQTTFEGRPGIAPAFGFAPLETKKVTLELDDGTSVAAELFDAPDRFGKFKFFLVFPPDADAKGTVVATDGSGEILQRGKLCAAGAPPGSTC